MYIHLTCSLLLFYFSPSLWFTIWCWPINSQNCYSCSLSTLSAFLSWLRAICNTWRLSLLFRTGCATSRLRPGEKRGPQQENANAHRVSRISITRRHPIRGNDEHGRKGFLFHVRVVYTMDADCSLLLVARYIYIYICAYLKPARVLAWD